MQEIKLRDINIESLKRIGRHGSNLATLYTDGDTCYKIYNNPYSFDNKALYNNFRDMDGMQIDGVLLPRDLIVDNNLLYGFTMSFFKDSITLSDKFFERFIDKKLVISAFNKASAIIRKMHQAGVVCQDLSLENILINSNGDIAICDPDSFAYKSYYSGSFSKIFCNFLIKYRDTKLDIWEDIDRISMFIAFYYLMFEKEIQNVSKHQYNKLSQEMKTVANLREIRSMLLDKKIPLHGLPYFDEFASSDDVGMLDKNKYLTIGQKVYRAIEKKF